MAESFFSKLLALFGPSNDPDAVKRRRLKELAKELAGNKYARFYKPKTGEIDGSLGKIIYDIYKIISPAQVFLQNASKSSQLKQVVVETFFDDNLHEIRKGLTAEAVQERANAGLSEAVKAIKGDLVALSSYMDAGRIGAIDRCYNNIMALTHFVRFDFFMLVKRFDSNITERNFSYMPKFASIRGEYASGDLKDFLELSFELDADQDWKSPLQALKTYKSGVDVLVPEQWNKVMMTLQNIRKSGVLELMIRHIDEKPDWHFKPKVTVEHIAESYLETKRTEVQAIIDKLAHEKKNSQAGALAKLVFGNVNIERAKYYTEKGSEIFQKKNFGGFTYAAAINYAKAFLCDYLQKEFRGLYDIVVVRGQWTNPQMSQETSETFHELLELSERLIAFDETLSEKGENGARLKTTIVKAERDKSQARYVTLILKSVNEEALAIIKDTALSLISLGKNLKSLMDDLQKPSHELIINWKELEKGSDHPLSQRISDAYKKIYYFVQILQAYASQPDKNANT
ncbi:MAG: DUF5312 domain-containing protein [Treponema sp.]|jgi:hypothetical protein|nr:DUF5312 domain-containing protein [Treponema sp.]